MNHNYGLPYKGSKNSIAERIVQCLPSGKNFLDACCGGGAILMQRICQAGTLLLLDTILTNPSLRY